MENVSPLVSTEWLSQQLGQANIKLLDTTVKMLIDENGSTIVSGRENFEAQHIAGTQFADLLTDLSDTTSKFYFALPSAQQFADVMGKLGIGNDDNVFIYSDGYAALATRLWWMFRVFGFHRAAVLDGGLQKWKQEGRALASGPAEMPATTEFKTHFNSELLANKQTVVDAIGSASAHSCLIDSLPADYFNGEQGDSLGYGRAGHITGAISSPADELLNPETGEYLPLETIQKHFAAVLENSVAKNKASQIITYCGGGVAATQNAFALYLLGHEDVAVYDGSLQEWAKDETLPMHV